MKILHLTLMEKWFDLIAAGHKTLEYREFKPYWKKRIVDESGFIKKFDEIHFRNGYGKTRPFMRVEFLGGIITHADLCNPEHGEELEGQCFVLLLGAILELRRSPTE